MVQCLNNYSYFVDGYKHSVDCLFVCEASVTSTDMGDVVIGL